MKFRECLGCLYRDQPDVCEDCDSGEQFEEDNALSFEDEWNSDNER